jgi:hypothetical protein
MAGEGYDQGLDPEPPMTSSRTLALLLAAGLALAPWAVALAEDPAPSAPPAPAPAPKGPSLEERAKVQAMVDELREEAAKIRGLAWKQVVPADLVTRAELRADFMEQIDVDYPKAKQDRDNAVLRRIGLLQPDQDIVGLTMEFMEAGVLGYYDPKKKHLRIVEGLVGPENKPTILHELIHALEDQYYDLEKRTKPYEEDGDRLFAEKCIVEGSAEVARKLYEKAHPDMADVFAKAEENPSAAAAQMKAIAKVPAWVFVSIQMHYQKGISFVGRQVEGGAYPERAHALFVEGPISQEQILHPGRWFGPRKDYPHKIVPASDLAKAAGEGWSVLHALPQGELDLALTLDFFNGPTKGRFNVITGQTPYPAAVAAARGWDGGMTWVLQKEGAAPLLVEAFAFDTPADAWEAAQALGRAAEKAAGKAWAAEGWKRDGTAESKDAIPTTATLDYVNQHGISRLHMDGTRILRLDGATQPVFDAFWPVVAATRFEKDPRDAWLPTDEGAALRAAGFVNEKVGIGLTVPNDGWTIREGGSNPRSAATATHAGRRAEVTLTVIEQEIGPEQLALMIKPEIKKNFPDFDGKSAGTMKVGAYEGLRLPMGRAGGGEGSPVAELVLAAGGGRTWLIRTTAPEPELLDAVRPEVAKLLESLVLRD